MSGMKLNRILIYVVALLTLACLCTGIQTAAAEGGESGDDAAAPVLNSETSPFLMTGAGQLNGIGDKPQKLTLTAPETLAIGNGLEVAVAGKEQNTYVSISFGIFKEDGSYMDQFPVYEWDEEQKKIRLSEMVFETAGNYRLRAWQYRWVNGSMLKSDEASVDFQVTGNRPAAPTVEMPEGPMYYGDIIWVRVSAPGAEAVAYEGEEYLAQNGTGLVPVEIIGWMDVSFRAKVNGIWSARSNAYSIEPEERNPGDIPGPGMTVPGSILKGQDLTIRNIGLVEGADTYTFSVGLYDEELSNEADHYYVIDQIIYDQLFDPADGDLVIPGCNFMETGKYGITIAAYGGPYNSLVSQTWKIITVEANANLPAAPTVRVLTKQNLNYGKTRFKVTTQNGADRIYVFVSRKDDYGLEDNPAYYEVDPSKTEYTIDWTNQLSGTVVAYFAISRNGIWSECSSPVEYEVSWPEEDDEMCLDFTELTCPAEVVIGQSFDVSWSPVEHAEWYEVTIYSNYKKIETRTIPGTETSLTVSTAGFSHCGNYRVRVNSFATGYTYGDCEDQWMRVLDPGLKIKASLKSVSGNIATLNVTGVTADRVRVMINGTETGTIAIGPGKTCNTIEVRIPDYFCTIQLANYGYSTSEWGTWSDPVTAKVLLLPEDLKQIEANAFEGIDSEIVIIPDGCVSIGAGAFRNCSKLTLVSLPEGTTIGDGAFEGCPAALTILRR